MAILAIAVSTRIIGLIYYEEAIKITRYSQYSLGNWIQITGSAIFLTLSRIALKSPKWSVISKKILSLFFIAFILLISFGVSYVVSSYNAKNNLTMFMIGIVTVSLFFAIEYKEISFLAAFVVLIFVLGMVIPKITIQDKMMNVFAAMTLGFMLIGFARYSYYFKSDHFVKIKELEEKNIEIEHLSTQKEEILAFVAHDLRNPLNNIEALSGFLLLENEDSNEAEMISTAAKQAKEIINDLIETVKKDQSDLKTEKQDISSFLNKVVQKWKANSKRTFLFIANDIKADVYLNTSKLERVIDNLISNGLKFSAEDKPIEISLTEHENKVAIVVKDFGIGIPEDLKKHIFQQFSKAGRQGLQGEKSIGLGLHISKRIVEQHAGKLSIDSKENEGTAFTILLPLA
ncbi:sensor histidine kinase [Pedobacter boryungensis]|uniref:histidine kinase n=1 Tax=Pedobacter boryungensis TaxID=869962 RepID=A0ABX2DCT3_9SPHI|nr:HAMP domain-containing sensor histidine kinase [Pedobacter boryungensis]NQX31238.1 HAMP domain-containing histidine kinase [Pedobacter boryungensis]